MQFDFIKLLPLLDIFANRNYEKGFDYWIETLSKKEKFEVISRARTLNGALKAFIDWNWKNGIQYSAIQSDNCALYDTGEGSDKAYYDHLQSNAKQSKSGLLKNLQTFVTQQMEL